MEREKKAQERKEKQELKKARKQKTSTVVSPPTNATVGLASMFAELDVEDDGQCACCGEVFCQVDDEDQFWVCCDGCHNWYCFSYHKLPTKDDVPDKFYCVKCN